MPDSLAAETERFHSLDLMSTLVAVLRSDGAVQFANAALENTLGLSRRTLEGADFSSFFTDPALLQTALAGARGRDFAALRYEASLKRLHQEPVPVHVNVADAEQVGEILVELWPLEQHARQDREERLRDQAQANKELIRNLAHEIKNPLGGIRGAAQLLRRAGQKQQRAAHKPGFQQQLALCRRFGLAVRPALPVAQGVKCLDRGDQHQNRHPAAPCQKGERAHAGAGALRHKGCAPDQGAQHQQH